MVLILIITIVFSTIFPCPIEAYAYSENFCYARVMTDDTYLYKTPTEDNELSNVMFILPKTYFVKATLTVGNFAKVEYKDVTGYVKLNNIKFTSNIPINPYLNNISFRVYSEVSRPLRTSPYASTGASNLIMYMPLYTRDVEFYGTIQSEAVIELRTTTWYYIKYYGDEIIKGYCYSDGCDYMTEYSDNTEIVTYIDSFEPNTEKNTDTPLKLGDEKTSVVIILLSIPALVFTIMVLKQSKILKSKNKKSKEIKDF